MRLSLTGCLSDVRPATCTDKTTYHFMLERALQKLSIGVDPLSRTPNPSASSAPRELTASAGRGRLAMRAYQTAAVEAAEGVRALIAAEEAMVCSLEATSFALGLDG
jgi:hypothetical protein